MDEEIKAYEEYLFMFGEIKKPIMPKFDVMAYTDSEYQSEIFSILREYDLIDDEYITLERFKGD